MTSFQSYAGNYVFVSGFANGREFFLGKVIDEPFNENISIEGKAVAYNPQGFFSVKPFTTLVNIPIKDPNYQVQAINHPEARNEVNKILTNSIHQIFRGTYPYTYRWIESSFFPEFHNTPYGGNNFNRNWGWNNGTYRWNGQANPFSAFYEGFNNSIEYFRRILFQSPQVTTTREMDKVTELEGNLAIEIGKITNQIAVKFNQVIGRENELNQYFEAIQGFNVQIPPTDYVGGWVYLMTRMQMAKNWCQRNGKTPLVREINNFVKEGITHLNEVIIEHCTTLDALISETCTQYGISLEVFGDLSPFSSYTTPYTATADTFDTNVTNVPVGSNF